MMIFRPLFWPTLFSVPLVALLIALGSWQLSRLAEKTELISKFEQRSKGPAIAISQIFEPIDNFEYQRVGVTGKYLHQSEIYLTGRTYEGNAGFHVITPFVMESGKIILVNRGWVSEKYRLPSSRPFSIINNEIEIDTILRSPQKKGYFVPENDPKNGFWFTLNPNEIAKWLEIENSITSFYLDILRKNDIITLPIAPKINIDIRNVHLNYALTWFGIAFRCSAFLGLPLASFVIQQREIAHFCVFRFDTNF